MDIGGKREMEHHLEHPLRLVFKFQQETRYSNCIWEIFRTSAEPGYPPLIRVKSPLGNTFGNLLLYRLLIVDQLIRSDIPLAKELQYHAKLDNSPLTSA